MNAVNRYTQRHLTQSSDKLVEISGVAKLIAASFSNKDSYVLGLWKRNLLLHMLWKVSTHQQASRPEPYRAPSWSWASVEGTIYNHRTNQEGVESTSALATIQDLRVEYVATEDPFGRVKSAEMIIRGRLIRVELELEASSTDILSRVSQLKWQGSVLEKVARLDFEMSANTRPPLAYCLPLVNEKYNGPNSSQWVSLLLRPVEGSRGICERFGLSDRAERNRDAVQRADLMELPEEEYISSHGNGIYTIRLV